MGTRINKILVVEDNEIIQEVLTRRLKKAGYNVDLAADGETGLRMISEIRPGVVLLDMNLPKLDGWEVAHASKANPLTKMIPIIALTALNTKEDQDKALKAGCDSYVAKPIIYDELLKQIANYLEDNTNK